MIDKFLYRKIKSNIAVEKFTEFCKKMGINFAFSGYETLLSSSPDFMRKIKELSNNDKTSKLIRYFPDITLVHKKSWLIEIKNSKYVEKDAYEIYCELSKNYNIAIIVYDTDTDTLLFCEIKNLNFVKQIRKDVPIENDIWIAPRKFSEKWTKKDYVKWKEKTCGSGTTYGKISFEHSKFELLKFNDIITKIPTTIECTGQVRIIM